MMERGKVKRNGEGTEGLTPLSRFSWPRLTDGRGGLWLMSASGVLPIPLKKKKTAAWNTKFTR